MKTLNFPRAAVSILKAMKQTTHSHLAAPMPADISRSEQRSPVLQSDAKWGLAENKAKEKIS
jgi:hypothetical protein